MTYCVTKQNNCQQVPVLERCEGCPFAVKILPVPTHPEIDKKDGVRHTKGHTMNDTTQAIRDALAAFPKQRESGLVSAYVDEWKAWYSACNLQAIQKLLDDYDALKGFAISVMGEWPDCGELDGFDLQVLGVKHGLLVGSIKTEPCGEHCNCAEYADFPMECFRKTSLLIDAARAQEAE